MREGLASQVFERSHGSLAGTGHTDEIEADLASKNEDEVSSAIATISAIRRFPMRPAVVGTSAFCRSTNRPNQCLRDVALLKQFSGCLDSRVNTQTSAMAPVEVFVPRRRYSTVICVSLSTKLLASPPVDP